MKLLSDETIKKVCEAVEQGLPKDSVAALAGVKPSTLVKWLKRTKLDGDKDPLIYKLGMKINEAHARFVARNVRNVQEAGDSGSYQASQWLLEKRDKKNFGKAQEEEGAINRVVVVPAVMSIDDWKTKHENKSPPEADKP